MLHNYKNIIIFQLNLSDQSNHNNFAFWFLILNFNIRKANPLFKKKKPVKNTHFNNLTMAKTFSDYTQIKYLTL